MENGTKSKVRLRQKWEKITLDLFVITSKILVTIRKVLITSVEDTGAAS